MGYLPEAAGLALRYVTCDRYDLSSYVYQSILDEKQELDKNAQFKIMYWLHQLNRYALNPDYVFYLDMSNEIMMSRLQDRNKEKDIFENQEFLYRVNENYQRLWDRIYPTETTVIKISGINSIDKIHNDIMKILDI